MLDPFYLALGAFAIFTFVTVSVSIGIRKLRNIRHISIERTSMEQEEDPNAIRYDGPVSLYEANARFEYDPDILVLKS